MSRKGIPNKKHVLKRFQEKFTLEQERGCWIWNGSQSKRGYGIMSILGKNRQATAVSIFLFHGPHDFSKDACHTCDNPRCVNPSHLFLATAKENMADCRAKGRFRYGHLPGSKNGRAKLKEADVVKILQRLRAGDSQTDIAFDYGVSKGTVYFISNGTTWKHVRRPL